MVAKRPLPFCQNAHVASEAGAAGGRADHRAGREKYFKKPFLQGLTINLLGGRNDDESQGRGDLLPFQDLGCHPEVVEMAIGAGADDDLIDLDLSNLPHILDVGRDVGKGDLGMDL